MGGLHLSFVAQPQRDDTMRPLINDDKGVQPLQGGINFEEPEGEVILDAPKVYRGKSSSCRSSSIPAWQKRLRDVMDDLSLFDPRDEEAIDPEIELNAKGVWDTLPSATTYQWNDRDVSAIHDALLVRSINSLMDNRCSDTLRAEITRWLNAPLVPEELLDDPEIKKILPFSFQACCGMTGVDPIELRDLIASELTFNGFKHEIDCEI